MSFGSSLGDDFAVSQLAARVVTPEMIHQKGEEFPQMVTSSNQVDGSNIESQDQLLRAGCSNAKTFYIRPATNLPTDSSSTKSKLSFGYDTIQLAEKVCIAYKDAPSNYKHIAQEVKSLQAIIERTAQHLQSTSLSDNNRQDGEQILKGCKSVLEELNSHIEKNNRSASTNKKFVIKRVKHDKDIDIAMLRAKLTLNATLLSDFIRRFDISTITIYYIMLISLP